MTSDRAPARTFRVSAVFGLMAAMCFAWAGYQSLRDAAAKDLSDVSFYGSVNIGWQERSTVDATIESRRQFPGVVAGPGVAREGGRAHTVRFVFRAESGYRVGLRLIQSDSSDAHPPRLQLSLNGAEPVSLDIQNGSGRDPITTERAGPHEYRITFRHESVCGDNEIRLTAATGTWVAVERIDIQLLRHDDVRRTISLVGLLALSGAVITGLPAFMWQLRRRRPRPDAGGVRAAAGRALVAGAAIVAALLVAERTLAFAATRSPSLNRLLYSSRYAVALPDTPEILTALMAHRCAEPPCSLYPCGFRLNRHGLQTADYQYAKAPGVTRVIGIGDSFMFQGGPVPHADSFFARLEDEAHRSSARTPFEFINLGFPCIGIPSERALLLQEGLRLDPDVVVWTIYLGNDITDESGGNLDQLKESDGVNGWLASWGDSWLVYRLASHVADLAAHDPKLLFPSCAAGRGALSPAGPATGRCGYLEDPHAGEPYDPSAKTLSDERYAIYGVDRLRTMYLESQQPQIHRLVNTMVRQFEAVRAQVGVGRVFPVLIPDQFQVSPAEVERGCAPRPRSDTNGSTSHTPQRRWPMV